MLTKDVQYINQKIRDCARGQPCMLRIPDVCNGDPETTVWCHSNQGKHGKGGARKAHDVFGTFGCFSCHTWLDSGKASFEEKTDAFTAAMERTWLYCFRNNIFKVGK